MRYLEARVEDRYLFLFLYSGNDLRQLVVNCFSQVSMSITSGMNIII